MRFERKATPALLAGALVALGVSGCSTWDHMTHGDKSSVATSEHRGPVQTASDAAITAKVKTAFAADATVKAANIDVDTVRGVVWLKGTVKDANERDRAMDIARNVSGVLDVRDELHMAG